MISGGPELVADGAPSQTKAALDPDDALRPSERARRRDQSLASAMEAHARQAGDLDFTPFVTTSNVHVISIGPQDRGDCIADLGRTLRSLPFFSSSRPWEKRREAALFQAFCDDGGRTRQVYSVGLRLLDATVAQDDFEQEYDRLSLAIPRVVNQARSLNLEVHFAKIEAPPHDGGWRLDLHAHLAISGSAPEISEFRKWLRTMYPTGWIGKRPRPAKVLAAYLQKGPCTSSSAIAACSHLAASASSPSGTTPAAPASRGSWLPEPAYAFALKLEGRNLKWTRYYGAYAAFRRANRCRHPISMMDGWTFAPAAPRPLRRATAPRDGEVLLRVGTYHAPSGITKAAIYVRGYRGDFQALTAKYRLQHAFSWAESFSGHRTTEKSGDIKRESAASPSISNEHSHTRINKHVNTENEYHYMVDST